MTINHGRRIELDEDQYRLSIVFGRAIADARNGGMDWAAIIATLHHSTNVAENSRDLDLLIAADAARSGAMAV